MNLLKYKHCKSIAFLIISAITFFVVIASKWILPVYYQNGYMYEEALCVKNMRVEIRVWGKVFYEGGQGKVYEVFQHGQLVCSMCYFGTYRPWEGNYNLQAIHFPNGSVIGVIDSTNPNVVLIMYDTTTFEHWPGGVNDLDEEHKLGLRLLNKLNSNNKLRLSTDVVTVGKIAP